VQDTVKHVNSNREKDIMCTCNVMSSVSCRSYSDEKGNNSSPTHRSPVVDVSF